MSIINNIHISNSTLNIVFENPIPPPTPTPTPTPTPSTGGTCVSNQSNIPDSWCSSNCGPPGTCTKETCPTSVCKWNPADPCTSSPCKNGGTCITSADKSSFTCTCTSCYSGDMCDTIKCGVNSECASGSPGCSADSNTCNCSCDTQKCYESSGQQCIYKCDSVSCPSGQHTECNNGVCSCVTGTAVPDKILAGYIGASTTGSGAVFVSNVIKSAKEAIKQGVNILVICFFSPDETGTLQATTGEGSILSGGRTLYLDIIAGLQDVRPTQGKPKYGEALIFISFGGAHPYLPAGETVSNLSYLEKTEIIHDDIINNFDIDGIDFDYESGFDTVGNYTNCLKLASSLKQSSGILSSAAPEGVCFTPTNCQCGCGCWQALLSNDSLDFIWPQIYDGTSSGRCDSLAFPTTGSPDQIKQQNTSMITANPNLTSKIVAGLPIGRWWNSAACPDMKLLAAWPSSEVIDGMTQTQYIDQIANISNNRGIMFWNIEWALGDVISPGDSINTASGSVGVDSGFIQHCADALGLSIT